VVSVIETLIDRVLAIEASLLWGGIFSWLAMSLVVGGIASSRGQSAIAFFFFSLLLSPLFGVCVAMLAPDERRRELQKLRERVEHLDRVAVVRELPQDVGEQAASPAAAPTPPEINESPLMAVLIVFAVLALVITVVVFFGPKA
jgi:hypothetical protein